jgi:hypothetical protein
MNQSGKLLTLLSLGVALSVSASVAQDTPSQDTPSQQAPSQQAPGQQTPNQEAPGKTLIVNGKTVDAAIIQVESRSYVDIEGLAQAIGGKVTFEPNQIALTVSLPAAVATDETVPEAEDNMSKQFQQLAVYTLAEMREWRGAVGTVVTSGLPVVGTWSQDYHDRIEADLLQTTLAASTVPDNQALQLLRKEFALLTDWANNIIGERNALDAARTIDPNSLQNDQSLAKISRCGQFLNSMIVGGNFYDDSSCQ